MKKLDKNLEKREYDPNDVYWNWIADGSLIEKGLFPTSPNIECSCGSKTFGVCWWDYKHTGGYCKITCSECGEELILIDDYA